MLSYDAATIAALERGALIIRDLVHIKGWDGDTLKAFGFWAGAADVNTNVVTNMLTGAVESRNYVGRALIETPPLPHEIGLVVRTVTVRLNALDDRVQDMIRAYDVRWAEADIHRGLMDVETGRLVAAPRRRFLGRVESAPINTGGAGGDSEVALQLVSHVVGLTRPNASRKSDATQRLRSGDRFRRYADTAGQVELWWGGVRGKDD